MERERVGGLTIRYATGYRIVRSLVQTMIEGSGLIQPTTTQTSTEKERLQDTDMAWKDLLATELPEVTGGRGAVATSPKVAIRENGQIALNSFAAKMIAEQKTVAFVVRRDDTNAKKFALMALDSPTYDKLLQKPEKERPAIYKLTEPKGDAKDKSVTISGSRFLRVMGYDYKSAGNQTFDVELETVKSKAGNFQLYVVTLPETTPTPKPKVTRERKPKVTDSGNAANAVAATAATPAPAPVAEPATPATPASDDLFD